MQAEKLLIVNADDYGMTPEICVGIIAAHTRGIVRSTTVMTGFATPDDIAVLLDSGIAAGLHFTLTAGVPFAMWPADLLTGEGKMRRSVDGVPQELMAEELELQWDALVSSGITPSHIDSHHHVHADPRVLSVVIEFALKRGVPVRPASNYAAALLTRYGVKRPACFSAEFYGQDKINKDVLLAILDDSHDDSLEIMSHPGHTSPELERTSRYSKEREIELAVLTDEGLATAIKGRGYRLGSYLDL